MDDVHVPTHQPHLQTRYSRVATFVGQDEFNGIRIGYPNKTLTQDVRMTFVDGLIPRESLTKMGVELNLVSASAASTKADWVQDSDGALCHEEEAFDRCLIISWLQ
jgi:hypothetical protein